MIYWLILFFLADFISKIEKSEVHYHTSSPKDIFSCSNQFSYQQYGI